MPVKKITQQFNYSKKDLIELVLRIDDYKEFLPWCTNSKILTIAKDKKDLKITADLEIGFKSFKEIYTSNVIYNHDKSKIEVTCLKGTNYKIMKIQIDGFDIELLTEEGTMTIKVLDANGKELSNNTYNQTETTDSDVQSTTVPTAEETATNVEPITDVQPETTETPNEVPATEENNGLEEGFVPTLEQFKKLRKEGKI